MPYKVIGRKVYHKIDGHWRLKQTATSHEKALGTVRLLRGVEHGWLPTYQKQSVAYYRRKRKLR